MTAPPARLYLDHAATSPLRPAVRDAMRPWWEDRFGNAASNHSEGRLAAVALREARERVAALVGAKPEQVIFTAGATEASNLAVRGGAHLRRNGGKHVVGTPIEHAATRQSLEVLAAEGYEVTLMPVDHLGRVALDEAATAIRHGTAIVTAIAGHNELGTIQPLAALADAAHAVGALLHLDAVQCAGYVPLGDVPWDLLSISAHKLGGPQGIGALVLREDAWVSPVLVGGAQERGIRPGTSPVALAVGFGEACAQALASRRAEAIRLAALRDDLAADLRAELPDLRVLGALAEAPRDALPHVLSLGVENLADEDLVFALDEAGIAASSSSACLSGRRSPALARIGAPESLSLLRLSLGWSTEAAALAGAGQRIAAAIARLRAEAPFVRRRRVLEARAAQAALTLTPAHVEAAQAVFEFHAREGVMPGARTLSRLVPAAKDLDALYPFGLPTLALWLGLPLPQGGCRPYGA